MSICRTAEGEPCDGGPSLDLGPALEGAWGVAGQALGAVALWVEQETRRAAYGSSGSPQPLASLADVNGPRRADLEFTLGATLATTELKFTKKKPSMRPSQVMKIFGGGPSNLLTIFEINP